MAFLSLGLIAGALFVFREQLFPNLVPDAENRAVSSDEAEVSVADIVVDTQAATGAFAKGDASTGNQLIDEKIESSDSNSDKASLELRRAELLQGVGDFDGAVDAALRAESLYGDATERYFAYLSLAYLYEFLQDYDAAIEYNEKIIAQIESGSVAAIVPDITTQPYIWAIERIEELRAEWNDF